MRNGLCRFSLVSVLVFGAVFGTAGTAISRKKPAKPTPAPAQAEDMAIEGIAGQLDAPAVLSVLEKHKAQLKKCYEDVSSRLRFLSGHIEIKLFIGTDGKARHVITQKSNLGSYEVEKCLVDSLGNVDYPAAKGGLGEITYPMDFAGMVPTTQLPSDVAEEQIGKEKKKLLVCADKAKKGKSTDRVAPIDAMRMTVYVAPGGQVASVGFSSPKEPLSQPIADCLFGKVRNLKLPDPLGKVVKFEYPLCRNDDL